MHQPGYIQEWQGIIYGYLLLGIYYRRIPGDTMTIVKKKNITVRKMYSADI
jgi:hypothetical protein